MKIIDKYNMTQEQNIFLAKRNIVDSIWKSANLEGINVTFPETQQIYDGGNISHLRLDEIVTINNLKHGWQFILNSIDTKADFKYLCSINAVIGSNLVENAGKLRYGNVKIGGTTWMPDFPDQSIFNKKMEELDKIENITEKILVKMCYMMKSQLFFDGNKRTAMLFANHEFIQFGKGILSIHTDQKVKFGELLLQYYEKDLLQPLVEFLYCNCIDGIEIVTKE